ncbi:polysaccharide deacetylase family protein [Christiangramia sp. SM2212]|uniref:Polysaccharide deacetylase family protein n=1 Tax=Christiangramia sediminicola TaxID=3073267 RepID=A0ABU1ERA7_9FLAO|nr:polysaccharide deacetylase family protein [Christiangramia sp. SM2212]MDR5590567.1 polysaccharide deacetylase family protein [Christiangramia sp. SM2212]
MSKGSLVISLDFEFIWGVFDKVSHVDKETYFLNTRKMIPQLINLLEDYGIHATWATVGMLFNKDWDQWMENIPEVKPDYNNRFLSAYDYGLRYKSEINDNLCFANDLIKRITLGKGQEMATHSYSHYYCLEDGQTDESFRQDLSKAIEIASRSNIEIKSLVFPRNQFNKSYLEICSELGLKTVRTNPSNWYWNDTHGDGLKNKIFRTGDAYIGTFDKSYKSEELISYNDSIVMQKASRLLRPKEGKLLDFLKINRIKKEISYAARNNEIYHLWWHPHNFGNDVVGNLDNLKIILDHFIDCKERYGMHSLNMIEIAEEYN